MSTRTAPSFRCIAGCPGDHSIWQPIYRCPTCGDLLQVVHDLDALRDRSAGRVDAALRRALQAHGLAVRLRRLGQEGVDLPGASRRERRLDGRGRHEPVLGRALRPRARRRRSLGEAVRQLAHRIVQGSRHDGARLGRQADDRGRRGRPRDRVRLDRRHVGGARRVRRRRRHSGRRDPAARHGHDRAARAAARQRRARARARHRLRRLHGDRAAAGRRKRASTSPTR